MVKYRTYNGKIVGKLIRTNRKVKPTRFSVRSIYKDKSNQLWVKISGLWYKFPEQIEY